MYLLNYLSDLQRYADTLVGADATRARKLLTIKSLLSFAARLGYMPFNVGAAIRPPRSDNRLAERILHERPVFALLDAVAGQARDHALLRAARKAGLEELVSPLFLRHSHGTYALHRGLTWRPCVRR